MLLTNSDIEKETEMHKGVQTEQDLKIVKQTLHDKLSPSLLNSMRPYERMTFSPDGIEYDNQFCTWYYIEHISKWFGIKDKNKGLARDWKGPCAQCWCGNNLYSPCDECPTCYIELRLWATIKQYSVEEVGQCYWSTPDDDYEEDPTLPEPYSYESLPLEPLFGQQLAPLVIQQAMTNVQINH